MWCRLSLAPLYRGWLVIWASSCGVVTFAFSATHGHVVVLDVVAWEKCMRGAAVGCDCRGIGQYRAVLFDGMVQTATAGVTGLCPSMGPLRDGFLNLFADAHFGKLSLRLDGSHLTSICAELSMRCARMNDRAGGDIAPASACCGLRRKLCIFETPRSHLFPRSEPVHGSYPHLTCGSRTGCCLRTGFMHGFFHNLMHCTAAIKKLARPFTRECVDWLTS